MRSALADIAKAADRLDVTTSEPKTVTDATETLSLGYRLKPKIGAIERANGALELSIGPVEDGMVLRAGKPAWWALTGNGRLLAAAPVTSERSLRIGVAWALDKVTINAMAED